MCFNCFLNKIINTLVSANKFLPMAVFQDSNGNGIPVNRQSSMSSNFRHNIKAFSKYNAGIPNIFIDNLQLSSNPYIRLELISKNSEQGIAADEMSIQEDVYSSFVYDFLKASKKGLFLTQPVAYSDKSTVLPLIKEVTSFKFLPSHWIASTVTGSLV